MCRAGFSLTIFPGLYGIVVFLFPGEWKQLEWCRNRWRSYESGQPGE